MTEVETKAKPELEPAKINELQKISAQFAAQLPMVAVSSGQFDPEAPPPPLPSAKVVGVVEDVPDGRYRVEGNDWIMSITGGKIIYARGRPDDDPLDIVTLPQQPVPVPPPKAAQTPAAAAEPPAAAEQPAPEPAPSGRRGR